MRVMGQEELILVTTMISVMATGTALGTAGARESATVLPLSLISARLMSPRLISGPISVGLTPIVQAKGLVLGGDGVKALPTVLLTLVQWMRPSIPKALTDVIKTQTAPVRGAVATGDGAKERTSVLQRKKRFTTLVTLMKQFIPLDLTSAPTPRNAAEREHAVNGSGAKEQISAQVTRTLTCALYRRSPLAAITLNARARGTAVAAYAVELLTARNSGLTS